MTLRAHAHLEPAAEPRITREAAGGYIRDMLEGLREVAVSAELHDLAGVLELAGMAAERSGGAG